VFTEQNIKAGIQATGLIPYNPQRVLTSRTVVRTPSPPATTANSEVAWTAETPRTVAQPQQQARLVQSQNPSGQAIRQLVKGCQIAMHSATILAEENTKLRTANQRQRRKRLAPISARSGACRKG
jgi:hypothetical protein